MVRKRIGTGITLLIIVIIVAVLGYYSLIQQEINREKPQEEKPITTYIPDSDETLTIMSWNIQTFGMAKWDKPEAKKRIIEIVPMADITFIQEIRDISGEVFKDLCREINRTHKCNVSSRAGRSNSKEQYGIVYKKDLNMTGFIDYNPHTLDWWERPPIEVTFLIDDYEFRATNIHIKPDDAVAEMEHLHMQLLMSSWAGNRMWLGDLNADCAYYDVENKTGFKTMFWVVKDTDDTTVSTTDCAYDRIILNTFMKDEYIRYGIYKNITKEVSDHYPIWVEIKPEDDI